MRTTRPKCHGARRERRLSAPYQPRNELGQIIGPMGRLLPGNGTLARDERAHLRGDRPRPKRYRHREWPHAAEQ